MAAAPDAAPDPQLVQAYSPGGFTVAGMRHAGSLLIFRDRVLPWTVTQPGDLDLASLEPVRTAQPRIDLLIVGTGAGFTLFPPTLRAAIRDWGVVVDSMATPAACRTYNILLAEGRAVAAALIAMPAS